MSSPDAQRDGSVAEHIQSQLPVGPARVHTPEQMSCKHCSDRTAGGTRSEGSSVEGEPRCGRAHHSRASIMETRAAERSALLAKAHLCFAERTHLREQKRTDSICIYMHPAQTMHS